MVRFLFDSDWRVDADVFSMQAGEFMPVYQVTFRSSSDGGLEGDD